MCEIANVKEKRSREGGGGGEVNGEQNERERKKCMKVRNIEGQRSGTHACKKRARIVAQHQRGV